ncbi:MAG: superoxide dismutase family protein [Bacteroidales bacterium]
MKKHELSIFGIIIIILGILSSCQVEQQEEAEEEVKLLPEVEQTICVLHPTEGNSAEGTVIFTKTDSGMHVSAEMTGLSEGKHGFHIHQYGNCSELDAGSAGGHFNPYDKPHGGPGDTERHVGDLGNINASEDGTATLEMVDTLLTFHGESSITGRAIVVHAGEDDLISQPTGDAGARVACGVIGIKK